MSDIKDILSLKGILDAAEKITAFTSSFSNPDEFFADEKSFDAVCMNFIVIGEMVDRISDGFKQKNVGIDWKSIKGLLLSHMIILESTRKKFGALFNCTSPR